MCHTTKSCELRGMVFLATIQRLFYEPHTDMQKQLTTSIRCNLFCSLVHSAPDPPEVPASYLALVGFHLRITPPSSMKITMATRGTSRKNPNAWRKNNYSAGVNTFTVNFSEFGRGSLARGVVSQARLLTPAEEESGHHAQLVSVKSTNFPILANLFLYRTKSHILQDLSSFCRPPLVISKRT